MTDERATLIRVNSYLRGWCLLALFWEIAAAASVAPAAGEEAARDGLHVIRLDQRVLCEEDGLLLGNGDLSVSVYQSADRIIWRFGKGDVWDRRLDLGDDPKPAHIDEIAHGIMVEGWKCGPYGGPVEATRGTQDPQRMRELCQGAPPSYTQRPYPCPKPVGELAMQLPPDLPGMRIEQRLLIEEGRLEITCGWPCGVKIAIECFVPPSPNVLVVRWKVENWNEQTRLGQKPPVWFSLYRWADPTIQEFAARFFAECRHPTFQVCSSPKATPLAAPSVRQDGGLTLIEQTFPPDPLFEQGFRYWMAPLAGEMAVEPVDMAATGEARLHLLPGAEAAGGVLAVAVTTSSDEGGPLQEAHRVQALLAQNPSDRISQWADQTRRAAAEFWSKSNLRIADPMLENLWYETLHARRCAYRRGTVPPGLFLPSTVQDYSHWHGDYHTNYNFQQPFWGDYTANHLELGDAYFDGVAFMLPIGRKIARDYYNCRGVFIQLSAYPIRAEDDPLGVAPMGRMAYMTGWTMNQYWWRYLYTLDEEWLRRTGYPVIRDCALFYTDFLKKGDDGLYHAFPSNQGEDGFSGNPKDYTDRRQVMQHLRYCLRAAIRASDLLRVDDDLRSQWRDRLEHCAGDDGEPPPALEGLAKHCYEVNPPEFSVGRPYQPQPESHDGQAWPPAGDGLLTWYFGQYPVACMGRLRTGAFVADRDLPVLRELIRRWRRPNGVLWGMSVADYGHAGAWSETLGVIAPLQEMMLQSWDGSLRIFPAWPKDLDARFEGFRAEGAFLVSAAWSKGEVSGLEIQSERGGTCSLYSPWGAGFRVIDREDREIEPTPGTDGRAAFETRAGNSYRLQPGSW
jgi:hypothetical protein